MATTKHVPGAPQVGRYAHPFFVPQPVSERTPVAGTMRRMTDWSKLQLGPTPPPVRKGIMKLEEIIGTAGVAEVESAGELRFHTLGDSGVGHADDAERVSDAMANDYSAGAGGVNPAFLFHLGDVIYGPEKDIHYGERFYRPYRHYPGKIIAVPGNHDGEVRAQADSPSLEAFRANFCAAAAVVPHQAADSGIYRETMTQPGVYWMLDTPFANIIGLYSNKLENPGYLQGITNGREDDSQLRWLQETLSSIAKAKQKKALVIATHHPPYSAAGHSGSTEMNASIDAICATIGIVPDLFLSGHSHTYQRYTRRMKNKQVPYIVAGTGGMPPQQIEQANGRPAGVNVTFDASASTLGYALVAISKTRIRLEFFGLGGSGGPLDTVTVDLTTHTIH